MIIIVLRKAECLQHWLGNGTVVCILVRRRDSFLIIWRLTWRCGAKPWTFRPFSSFRPKAPYQEHNLGRYLRYDRRNWITCPLSTSSLRTTGCLTRRSGSRRDQCASSSLKEQRQPRRVVPRYASRMTDFLYLWSPATSSSTPASSHFPSRAVLRGRSLKEAAVRAAKRRTRPRGSDMAPFDHWIHGHATRTRQRTERLSWNGNPVMTTCAKPDQNLDTLVHDQVLTTDLLRIRRSGLRNSDVASSICENPPPDSRGLGLDNIVMRGPSRAARRDDGVCNNCCTKCIQLGLMCLIIIISQEGVGRITASLSVPYFHPLFYSLFSRGDLEYCLYVKVSLFYNMYKDLVEEMSSYVFLLSKNGSILE